MNILQAVTGIIDLTEQKKKLAELNGDGEVTSADALIILQKVTGIIDTFPVDETPVEYTVNVTTDDQSATYTMNSGETALKADLYYPVVEITGNPNATAVINQTLQSVRFSESYIQQMIEERTADEGCSVYYTLETNYKKYINGNILSIVVEINEARGGANGDNKQRAFNFDISTGALITEDMLFGNSYDSFKDYASQYIFDYNSKYITVEYAYQVAELMKSTHWYINENGEFIQFFNKYELGPAFMMFAETAIPDAASYYTSYYAGIMNK